MLLLCVVVYYVGVVVGAFIVVCAYDIGVVISDGVGQDVVGVVVVRCCGCGVVECVGAGAHDGVFVVAAYCDDVGCVIIIRVLWLMSLMMVALVLVMLCVLLCVIVLYVSVVVLLLA